MLIYHKIFARYLGILNCVGRAIGFREKILLKNNPNASCPITVVDSLKNSRELNSIYFSVFYDYVSENIE